MRKSFLIFPAVFLLAFGCSKKAGNYELGAAAIELAGTQDFQDIFVRALGF